MDKTEIVIAFFAAAVVAGLAAQHLSGPPAPAAKETFMQQELGMPLNSSGMGPYDQGGASGWAASEPMPVSQSPANNPMDSNKLMLLADNKSSPDCCPGAFNTDVGCVCLNEHDRKLFASRGGNRA